MQKILHLNFLSQSTKDQTHDHSSNRNRNCNENKLVGSIFSESNNDLYQKFKMLFICWKTDHV